MGPHLTFEVYLPLQPFHNLSASPLGLQNVLPYGLFGLARGNIMAGCARNLQSFLRLSTF